MFNKEQAWLRLADRINRTHYFMCNILFTMACENEISHDLRKEMVTDLGIVSEGEPDYFEGLRALSREDVTPDELIEAKILYCILLSQFTPTEIKEMTNEQSL